jgi:hypothetical protein
MALIEICRMEGRGLFRRGKNQRADCDVFQIYEFHKIRKLSWLNEDILAWEEGLYSTVLVSLEIGSYLARIVTGQKRSINNASDLYSYSRPWPFWILGVTPVTLNDTSVHSPQILQANFILRSENWNRVASLNSLRRSFVILHLSFDAAAASLNTPQKYVIWNCSYSCHLLSHIQSNPVKTTPVYATPHPLRQIFCSTKYFFTVNSSNTFLAYNNTRL